MAATLLSGDRANENFDDKSRQIGASKFYVGTEEHFKDESYTFSDWNAGCMALNSSGGCCLLAGRRGFALVDINGNFNVKKVNCSYKWEPNTVEWNPHPTTNETFAAAISQKVECWKVTESSCTLDGSLKGHTRAISDLNWNCHDPNLLLTCSMDTYLYLWDMRESRRPSQVFTAVAGSSQIKWNKVQENIFASSHDGDIRIWDARKGNFPLVYIAGHLSKIHGIDWSPFEEHDLVTASSDTTVKFWDITQPKTPKRVVRSGSPVWRARYTPFGDGIVTVVVPQIVRPQGSLKLWNLANVNNPVHTFYGHDDVVLEFQWRWKDVDGELEYQLVTWSKDQQLKLWALNPKILKAFHRTVGSDSSDIYTNGSSSRKSSGLQSPIYPLSPTIISPPSVPDDEDSGLTKTSADLNVTLEADLVSPTDEEAQFIEKNQIRSDVSEKRKLSSYKKLEQEFALINVNNPILHFNELNAERRYSSVSMAVGPYKADLFISFPSMYPENTQPIFQFSADSHIDEDLEQKLLKSLHDVSLSHVLHNRPCFEACLRSLVPIIEDAMLHVDTDLQPDFQSVPRYLSQVKTVSYGSYEDPSIPAPRTSGARFCGVDKLVYFTLPPVMNADGTVSGQSSNKRCFAALSGYTTNALDEAFNTPAFVSILNKV